MHFYKYHVALHHLIHSHRFGIILDNVIHLQRVTSLHSFHIGVYKSRSNKHKIFRQHTRLHIISCKPKNYMNSKVQK